MLFSDALEVAIGLTFVFLMMSLILTAVKEAIESIIKRRGVRLFEGFTELLGDPLIQQSGEQAARRLYEHPQIRALYRGDFDTAAKRNRVTRGNGLPSYIPSRNFALALIGQVLSDNLNDEPAANATLPAAASRVGQLRFAAERIKNEQVRRLILQAVARGGDSIENVQKALEASFDSAMDRVSGWYTRHSQRVLFVMGLAIAIFLNINALTIAESLSKDATLRRAIAEQAEHFQPPAGTVTPPPAAPGNAAGNEALPAADAATNTAGTSGTPQRSAVQSTVQPQLDRLEDLGLPIGWSGGAVRALVRPWSAHDDAAESSRWGWRLLAIVQIALGFLMTAFATTLGAPFWFDILNRLMVIRSTVKPHEKSGEEGSQDPQDRPAAVPTSVVINQNAAAPATAPPSQIDTDIFAEPPGPDERPLEEDPDMAAAAAREGEGGE
ncbi:MAG: hypothetical protein QOH47_68 [Sphingomonadales bacterium]|jgi:hypothetical protein|nr:hypothetical protein [Sphingomonadales bacterium]